MLENNIDIAVHSLKDMESEQHENLMIGAYIKRNDPRDVLICKKINNFNELSKGAKIGSSSILVASSWLTGILKATDLLFGPQLEFTGTN